MGGTSNLFTAARDHGVRRIVFASSSSVYGDTPTLPKREGEEGDVLSPYAMSKLMCEQLAEIFQRCYQMEIVGLRYFNVFGPRQRPDGPYAAVIPRFFAAYHSGTAPTIFGDGEQSRDFTYVGDAVRANLLAAGAPVEACGRSYNVAGGKRVSLNQLWKLIRDLVGGGPEPVYGDPRPGRRSPFFGGFGRRSHGPWLRAGGRDRPKGWRGRPNSTDSDLVAVAPGFDGFVESSGLTEAGS